MPFKDYDEETQKRFLRLYHENPEGLKAELKDDPSTFTFFDELVFVKTDPQEDDPIIGPKIVAAGHAADKLVPDSRGRGRCHAIWKEQKRILLEQGIDWKSPAEMNPHRFFD